MAPPQLQALGVPRERPDLVGRHERNEIRDAVVEAIMPRGSRAKPGPRTGIRSAHRARATPCSGTQSFPNRKSLLHGGL
jgi:hypothetical protein